MTKWSRLKRILFRFNKEHCKQAGFPLRVRNTSKLALYKNQRCYTWPANLNREGKPWNYKPASWQTFSQHLARPNENQNLQAHAHGWSKRKRRLTQAEWFHTCPPLICIGKAIGSKEAGLANRLGQDVFWQRAFWSRVATKELFTPVAPSHQRNLAVNTPQPLSLLFLPLCFFFYYYYCSSSSYYYYLY